MTANGNEELRVELLGPPRAWLGRQELHLGPARQRAVFAVLALHANQVVSRRDLIAAVWGESPPASADGSVHTYISGLRRRLEPDRDRWAAGHVLTSQPAGYLLRLPEAALDVAVFDRLRDQGQRQLAAQDAAGARESLDAALALWRGEPLSGVPGPAAELERERLVEARLVAAEHRARAVLATDGQAEVVAELTALSHDYPLRESLRELLMIALYQAGRQAEALEVFHQARRVLLDELGIEPGPALRRTHERVLANDPALGALAAEPGGAGPAVPPLSVVPAPVARAAARPTAPGTFVGRAAEAARLRQLVTGVLAGRGAPVWIEGEPGIGKSALLAVGLADAGQRGCQLGWVSADEFGQDVPLRVVLDCLGVSADSPDPRRARLAGLLGEQPAADGWVRGDPVLAAVDQILALVDELCARAPLVLVVDDLQWADQASVVVWHRLCAATRQLPLLLVAASRPTEERTELAALRRSVEARNGELLTLTPLSDVDTESLASGLLGGPAGPGLRELVGQAQGNPLYLRELLDALVRADAVTRSADGVDVLASAVAEAPRSLVAAIGRRIALLSEPTRDVLCWAALFGVEFGVAELAAVTGRRVSELAGALAEAVAKDVVVDVDARLSFRHPLLRQALCDTLSPADRAARHRRAAEALAGAGAAVTRVAEHLGSARLGTTATAVDDWVVAWVASASAALSNRVPLIAADLLDRVLAGCPPDSPHRVTLGLALVRVLFRLERNPEALIRQVLATATEPRHVAELRHLLAAVLHRTGRTAEAVRALGSAADDPEVPELWRVRHRQLLANFRRGDLSDLDATEAAARQALAQAGGEPYLVAHAEQTLWLVNSIRRRHDRALEHVDQALAALTDDAELAGLHLDLLDNRVFTLQNLDRLAEADSALRRGRAVAARYALPNGLGVTAAVHHYWTGRWTEALVELDAVAEDGPEITFYGLREPGPAALLLYGVAALIAGRRDERAEAAALLDAAEEHAVATNAERESCDFLLVAQALAAVQRDRTEQALSIADPILDPGYAPMMLRHQWLPDVARLAVRVGDLDRAWRALAVCEQEAARETVPARAFAAAAHCRGLVTDDPEPVLAAADHHRSVGRRLELATALEDAAVLLAGGGHRAEAAPLLAEASEVFADLGAHWDLRRVEARLHQFGLRPTSQPRPDAGWAALSPLEAQIAALVAAGRSNLDIAGELALPRRTVQAHVARVLGKLHAPSRAGAADRVRRHRANADRDTLEPGA
ncbi:BTAD domain-containing putative transcriptional regulator [Goodfellowiella coeruleoviolacea]|uniref:Regulatory protein, luxR family n=1 Tax=Goodfellowiella coeruleoviolacea TaxID=334858 RepID=A0AAE3GCD7_9PSEU|nr:BTAD domain-containing putative transcriptional regulator [Goodfellowiella coeruleoviolacea]MCP2163588.1 regulatory protein, luxR family [Goodfellowiella coeruleoviolacea]